jgi:hypothetical protein
MGQGHVSCPDGIDRVKIIDRLQELIAVGQSSTTARIYSSWRCAARRN